MLASFFEKRKAFRASLQVQPLPPPNQETTPSATNNSAGVSTRSMTSREANTQQPPTRKAPGENTALQALIGLLSPMILTRSSRIPTTMFEDANLEPSESESLSNDLQPNNELC